MYIGIDVGNSGIKMAYVDRTGQPVPVRGPRGGNSIMSVIYIDPTSGKSLIGEDAFEQSFVDPANAVSQFKLKLGSDDRLLADRSATDLVAMLLVEARKHAERQTGESIDAAVVTVPANFMDIQKKAVLKAADIAGIGVLRLISEPAAAGFGYATRNATNKRGEKSLVYDLGSSTFDVTVIEADGDAVSVLATEGVQKLGGDDLDAALQTIVLRSIEQKTGKTPAALLGNPLFKLDLATRVTRAKVSLGTQDRVQIPLSPGGQPLVVAVERGEFESAIQPLIDQTLACVDRALAAAKIGSKDLSSLYMVGGPSRSPFVQNAVSSHTGLVPRCEIDPETAVAQGAALVAQSDLKAQGKQSRVGTDVIPQPDAFLREVTHHDIGVAVDDRQNGRKSIINSVVVPKNTPIPSRHTQCFRLESADQRDVIIEVLQGPNRADIAACQIIGRLEQHGLPVEPARSPRIEVTFELDKNTCVTVTARDTISGQSTSATVDVPK